MAKNLKLYAISMVDRLRKPFESFEDSLFLWMYVADRPLISCLVYGTHIASASYSIFTHSFRACFCTFDQQLMYVFIFLGAWLSWILQDIREFGSLRVVDIQAAPPSTPGPGVQRWPTFSVTILPVFGGKRDSENLVGSAHKQPWRPPAANMCPLWII